MRKPKLTKPKLTKPKLTGPKLSKPKLTKPKLSKPKLTGPKLSGPKLKMTAALFAFAATAASAQEVRVYNWSDYIDESLLEKFEQETGIDLTYDVFDSNEVLETKMLAGSSGYDVVVPSGTFLQRQIAAGAFQKLDKSQLPNLENMWDVVEQRTAQYDPGNEYSINYMWGTTGLGVNVGKVTEVLGEDAPMGSLALIFEPENMEKLAECGVHFLDAPTEMIPAALKYIGEDPDAKDAETLEKAEPVLSAVRPYVQKFHNSEYINALANGDICVAFGWSGDILQARDRAAEAENGVEIEYHAPSEGALMWFDQMAIPVDAPNPEAAHTFLNFIMDAQNMATASNYVYYANGNEASQEFLNEDVIGDTAIYPDAETLENLYTTTPYDARTQRTVTRMWTGIKSGT
jgi:putrescine transport system substrate-binding protein